MATTTTSQRYTLNVRDLLRGLLLAVISAVLTALLPLLEEGNFDFNWRAILGVAATTAASYLLKNFLERSKIVITDPPKEEVKAVKEGTAEVTIQKTP